MSTRRTISCALVLLAGLGWMLSTAPAFGKPNACTTSSPTSTATCSGNQSAGVKSGVDFSDNRFNNVTVNNLTGPITPAAGVPGIEVAPGSNAVANGSTITFSGGANGIATTGSAAHGIFSHTQGGAGRGGSNNAGDGGTGGAGGVTARQTVTVNGSSITTSGGSAYGVAVTSVSGSGGVGGSSVFSSGGVGGAGGAAGSITVNGSGSIVTSGDRTSGIFLSGAGGVGGDGRKSGITGSGGRGGAGGRPPGYILNSAGGNWAITTRGATNSPAVFIQDRGGKGGDAGDGSGSGGGGGAGGNSQTAIFGSADVGAWTLSTQGTNSPGIFLNSIGGNSGVGGRSFGNSGPTGGNGGVSAAFEMATIRPYQITSTGSGSPGILVLTRGGTGGDGGPSQCCNGGTAGSGGAGGSIIFRNTGTMQVTTSANQSPGASLVTNGGNGGNGGSAGIGGGGKNGGAGASGGSIQFNANSAWNVLTRGVQSAGISALSLGGTGGRGSDGSFFNPSPGSGGSTADGLPVTVGLGGPIKGTIQTFGPESPAMVFQSVTGHAGGGGGSGGVVGFGAAGGSAGTGGAVAVNSSIQVNTWSDQSPGLVAQSIGGGGGNGGSGFGLFYGRGGGGSLGGRGGAVTVVNTGDIVTGGEDSHGLVAQSIGGTGGDGGSAGALVALGGGGTNTSNGGPVNVTNSGAIVAALPSSVSGIPARPGPDPTCGTGCSLGILAQSIGGGGGTGGSTGGWYSVGGRAGGGGNGGAVTVAHSGAIDTYLKNSTAILAQSIGGGGGNGGGSGAFGVGFAVAIGGAGAVGGSGSTVAVTGSKTIGVTSRGDDSMGIVAQSIGGGGGNGGFAVSGAVGSDTNVSAALGATGGPSGNAGAATIGTFDPANPSITSRITTLGKNANAVLAQSIGGGGGTGGFAVALSGAPQGVSVGFGFGGRGGTGGNSSSASITNNALVQTAGSSASGLVAQSIGGGGGNGGFSLAGSLNLSGAGVAISLGGRAGSGGAAGTASISHRSARITTGGDQAHGILAQSLGGGGGNGGLSFAGTITRSTGGLAVAVGGNGGRGGNASGVDVVTTGSIVTTGNSAKAIMAQSVGGGGGNGGLSLAGTFSGPGAKQIAVSLGGVGSTAGNGGNVTVTNGGRLTTGTVPPIDDKNHVDIGSHAILAQSIGGGGGSGGLAGSMVLSTGQISDSRTVGISVALGGSGGAGGSAGQVNVTNIAGILTKSNSSSGILAQSIGGGGGDGGSGIAISSQRQSFETTTDLNVAYAMGGRGGTGNIAQLVRVTNNGSIDTGGANSHAIYAQSIGGGGGNGGEALNLALNAEGKDGKGDSPSYNLSIGVGGNGGTGSNGGEVRVDNSASLATTGNGALGILVQSIGGGGGNAGDASGLPTGTINDRVDFFKSMIIQVGGAAGASGSGGPVTVNQSNAAITTDGINAAGIFAQSIGGGGGRGGSGAAGVTGDVSVGGRGGAAGNGGAVAVTLTNASITTQGPAATSSLQPVNAAYGIFAQSVGGGGGVGGDANLDSLPVVGLPGDWNNFGAGRAIALPGGSAGDGGTVTVNATGNIRTTGNSAAAIFAQSVGGGGGVTGQAALGSRGTIIGNVGGSGSGGRVEVNYRGGTITTTGEAAHGIFAQSIGGSTRNGSPGRGGNVAVRVGGNIFANGRNANGIMAQSEGLGRNGTVDVIVDPGAIVQGGTGIGNGVLILGGSRNTLVNKGTVFSASGGDGYAVRAGTGNDRIRNRGLIVGSVDLGSGRNRILNHPGGLFRPGEAIDLDPKGRLTNQGTIIVGGGSDITPHRLTGDFVQSRHGTLRLVIDGKRPADQPVLQINGNVRLAGELDPVIRNAALLQAGSGSLRVLRATRGLGGDDLRRLKVEDDAIAHYDLKRQGEELRLRYKVDLDGERQLAALDDNQGEVAHALDAARQAGELDPQLLDVIAGTDLVGFATALERLSAEPYADNQVGTLFSSLRFSGSLFDCAALDGDVRVEGEQGCGWMRAQASRFKRDGGGNDDRFEDNSYEIAAGAEALLGQDWRVGGGLAYDRPDMESGQDADTDGHQLQVGVTARRAVGPWLLGVGASAGMAWLDVDRDVGTGQHAKGDQDLAFLTGQARAGYRAALGDWRLEPRVDLAATVIHTDDVNEHGRRRPTWRCARAVRPS